MRIAIICDLHMPDNTQSSQYYFLSEAAKQMRKDQISTVISLGDLTAFGEIGAREKYLSVLRDFDHYPLMGNSDVRDSETFVNWFDFASTYQIQCEGRTILGINTPFGRLEPCDRAKIAALKDGDMIAMHHSVRSLELDSRNFITALLESRSLTVLHGHHHNCTDDVLGKSRIIGFRALDADKAIGNYPTIFYADITPDQITFEEKYITLPKAALEDARKHFGISCVDNHKDVAYAAENNVYAVELRCNGKDWIPDPTLIPVLEQWRSKTNGYLSVHMPNVHWKNDQLTGVEQWEQAAEYAKLVGVNGLTIHPPRVNRNDMYPGSPAWNAFLTLYKNTVVSMPASVNIGIENLHLSPGEPDTPYSPFGCNPQEVISWIDSINEALGINGRVGHTLDVGHARNNGSIATRYAIGRWYEIMGNRTVAYHIHQVARGEKGMKNHSPIENWFGPMVSYVSFFHCWDKGIINHKPVFLEVKGWENYKKSIDAFYRDFPEMQ